MMISKSYTRHALTFAALIAMLVASTVPGFARNVARNKQLARTQFQNAERMREALNGLPSRERSKREYERVADAYRRVYYMSPGSSKAGSSVIHQRASPSRHRFSHTGKTPAANPTARRAGAR